MEWKTYTGRGKGRRELRKSKGDGPLDEARHDDGKYNGLGTSSCECDSEAAGVRHPGVGDTGNHTIVSHRDTRADPSSSYRTCIPSLWLLPRKRIEGAQPHGPGLAEWHCLGHLHGGRGSEWSPPDCCC